jgi:hypothetical protein
LLGKLADLFARGLERWWLRWHPGYAGGCGMSKSFASERPSHRKRSPTGG